MGDAASTSSQPPIYSSNDHTCPGWHLLPGACPDEYEDGSHISTDASATTGSCPAQLHAVDPAATRHDIEAGPWMVVSRSNSESEVEDDRSDKESDANMDKEERDPASRVVEATSRVTAKAKAQQQCMEKSVDDMQIQAANPSRSLLGRLKF